MEDYAKTKIYFDGSHYIGIPHQKQPWKKRKNNKDVLQKKENEKKEIKENKELSNKEMFEEVYKENLNLSKKEKKKVLSEKLKDKFKNEESLKEFINMNMERKRRNSIVRKVRLMRKVNLQEWDYFCTFTYDDKKCDEQQFKKTLSNCFKKLCYRRGWKYAGVWERSPITNRLHFHGLFYTPNMVGDFIETKDYNTTKQQMQTAIQNSYFLERFGRNDFKPIVTKDDLSSCVAYLMKYMEKTGEKIVYSKNLPTYFVSDILPDDVICKIGIEDKKLLLFDDFHCLDEGVLIGKVSKETISQMPKTN